MWEDESIHRYFIIAESRSPSCFFFIDLLFIRVPNMFFQLITSLSILFIYFSHKKIFKFEVKSFILFL